jgi:Cft2 family RNA processing exonuclease
MSTFDGNVKEIQGIAVDHFANNDLKCYFISHVHSDHLKELNNLKTEAPIYTSKLSKLVIKKKYPHLNVEELETAYQKEIRFEHENEEINFIVTLINAGHCLGN